MPLAMAPGMTTPQNSILDRGSCEPLKACVHVAALGLFTIMGLYNAAAWLRRRDRHLAVNAVLYGVGILWEQRHVARHLASCRELAERRERLSQTDRAEDAA